jgi:YD repeat-containing protein
MTRPLNAEVAAVTPLVVPPGDVSVDFCAANGFLKPGSADIPCEVMSVVIGHVLTREGSCPASPSASSTTPSSDHRTEFGVTTCSNTNTTARGHQGENFGRLRRHGDDDFCRLASESVDGEKRTFGYDDDGLLTSAGDETLTYDATTGQLAKSTLGVVENSWTYDEFGALASHAVTIGGVAHLARVLTPDAIGRLKKDQRTSAVSRACASMGMTPRGV